MMNSFLWGSKRSNGGGINWMRWERVCVRKEDGGMGFRDLRNFNLAMIFKARFFPHGDFLSAPKGNGPSYVWQSIRKSQAVTAVDPQLQGLKVCDLLIPSTLDWDLNVVEAAFDERDVKEILSVPLGVGGLEDTRIWHYKKSGLYTVRSAYRILMSYLTPRDELNVHGAWNELWSLHVSPKIKNLAWRLARDVVPNRTILRRRNLSVPELCGLCSLAPETNQHLFLECQFAEDCWNLADLQGLVMDLRVSTTTFTEWLMMVLHSVPEPRRSKVIAVLWGLWRERNQRVWSQEAWTASKLALEGLWNWEQVQQRNTAAGGRPNVLRCGK
ncbi:Putative ribonuclease H protein At1g65750 [Linum perenne]